MDFFTFIIIGVFIYSFFSRKNKAPQRSRGPAEQTSRQPQPQESSRPARKKEGFFESIERQIRESAEALEKELNPEKGAKTATMTKPALDKESYVGVEGAWGVEGRSDYGRHQSKQGNVINEKRKESVIEQTSVETGAYAIGNQHQNLKKAVGFSSSEIVQGVIWAEVLKQPRGMRTYSRK